MTNTFLIISHVLHKRNTLGEIGGYAPYIREMNIWLKYVEKVIIVAPVASIEFDAIDIPYNHSNIEFRKVPAIDFTSVKNSLISICYLPFIMWKLTGAMRQANHIHLRCPGNMGLLGCFAQLFFPKKKKTAKYAGNWDWNSLQPASYRLQQKILQSELFTKNMTALVYGKWQPWTKNLKEFFTASYSAQMFEKPIIERSDFNQEIRFVFAGTLSEGKQPLLSAQTVKHLIETYPDRHFRLDFLGEGAEREKLQTFIDENNLQSNVFLHGSVHPETVVEYLQQAHFLLFISKSEGWPKAVAEAMCWGCVPVTTDVSCVGMMLDYGKRGKLVNPNVYAIADALNHYLCDENYYQQHSDAAQKWSRQYTLERFEEEIKKLLIVNC